MKWGVKKAAPGIVSDPPNTTTISYRELAEISFSNLEIQSGILFASQVGLLTAPAISVTSSNHSVTLSAHLKKVAIASMVLCCILECQHGKRHHATYSRCR